MEPMPRIPPPASPPPEQVIGVGVGVGVRVRVGESSNNERPLYTPRGSLRRIPSSVKVSSAEHVETGAIGGREQICYECVFHPSSPEESMEGGRGSCYALV
eukprot:scaffold221272_cov47-Attheya_sp.AAC.1